MHLILVCNQDVFRLDVTVDHVTIREVDQCLNDLCDDQPCLFFREELLPPELLVQVPVLAELQHHVDTLFVVEVAVKPDKIRMVKSPLDLELPLHLGEEIKLLEHMLENDLQSHRHIRPPLGRRKDLPELATPDSLDASKVFDSPRLLGLLGLLRGLTLLNFHDLNSTIKTYKLQI